MENFPYYYDPCKDKVIINIVDTKDKKFFIFGARHQSKKSIMKFIKYVLPEIKNPKEWLFLIEGKGLEIPGVPEISFYINIASQLEIPVENPIISPLAKKLIDDLARDSIPIITQKDVLYVTFYTLHQDPNFYLKMPSGRRKNFVKALSFYSGIPEDSIEIILNQYVLYFTKHPTKISEAQEYFLQITHDLIEKSNKLSLPRLKKILDKYEDKKYIFIYAGMYHLPLFENLRIDSLGNEIPHSSLCLRLKKN